MSSGFDFSIANTHYLLVARSLIEKDVNVARIQLRVDDETLETLRHLSNEDIRLLGALKTPIMSVRIDPVLLKDLRDACDSKLTSRVNQFSDRLLLSPR